MELTRFALAMVGHLLASLLYVLNRLRIVDAVVDTTSILEHREELRELWEKRMMADENTSSPSSALEENSKPQAEEAAEDKNTKAHSEGETIKLQNNHLSNGFAKTVQDNVEDGEKNHVPDEPLVQLSETAASPVEDNQQENNNNSADSLQADNNNEVYVEEKMYSSQLETCLVVKQVTSADHVTETIHNEAVSDESVTTSATEGDGQSVITDVDTAATVSDVTTLGTAAPVEVETEKQTETIQETSAGRQDHENLLDFNITCEPITPMKSLEIPTPTEEEEGDGFVPLAACLPQEDDPEDGQNAPDELTERDFPVETHKEITTNGYGNHNGSSPTTSTPEPSLDEKRSHPEMEQFLKSGGVKRILPGVQKTEQPYSSCTTETKIAMEIREMREREEELRIMREQALISPVVSPVPPKSPAARSPSPSIKDGASPTPAGPGYRVSSVFGHKGTISPSPPIIGQEDRKPFKLGNAESAVEKEIRMARDREEELRKQKGLPPREDDSYVKPSQVKSSQVRIFGKPASSISVKQAATAKIQLEIEEQTQREMALREAGSIQTISQERTDAKVTKLTTECTTPPLTNGSSPSPINGNYANGRHSPDVAPYKRSSPSPTGLAGRPASIFSQTNGKSNISMQKFIASKGKESTFTSPKNGTSPFILGKEEKVAVVPPTMVKLKRTVSVESKIQQEIMEMKLREDELKKLHMNKSDSSNEMDENGYEHEMNQKNSFADYENGNGIINDEDLSPRHNKLIAQWEQRCQKAES